MANQTRRRGRGFVGNVVAGLVTAGLLTGGSLGLSLMGAGRELRIESVLRDRAGAFGPAPAASPATVEILTPFCGTPHVVVADEVRYATRLVICVFVARVWNHTRRTMTVAVRSARLRFGRTTYADVSTLRVVPEVVPPGCAVLVAIVFEVRRDERGRSVLLWKFSLDAGPDVKVAQPLGPMRTSDPMRVLPPDSPPAAECPGA
jgi:hypothetical protein